MLEEQEYNVLEGPYPKGTEGTVLEEQEYNVPEGPYPNEPGKQCLRNDIVHERDQILIGRENMC